MGSSKAAIAEALTEVCKQIGSSGVANALGPAIDNVLKWIGNPGVANAALPAGAAAIGLTTLGTAAPLLMGGLLIGGCLLQCRRNHKDARAARADFESLKRSLDEIRDESRSEAHRTTVLVNLLLENHDLRERLERGEVAVDAMRAAGKAGAAALGVPETEFEQGVRIYLGSISDRLELVLRNQDRDGGKIDYMYRLATETDEDRKRRYEAELRPRIEREVRESGVAQSPAQAAELADAVVRAVERPQFVADAENMGGPAAVLEQFKREAAASAQAADAAIDQTIAASRRAAEWAIVIGDVASAAECLDNAIRLRSDDTWVRILRSRVAVSLGSLEEAHEHARRALNAARSQRSVRDESVAYNEIGDVKVSQGDQAGALASYESGLRIAETLSKQDPKNAAWQRDLSVSYDRIGDVKVSQGDQAGALASYESGLRIAETLSKQDPKNAEWQRDLSVSYDRIGDVKVSQGDQAGALASYESGLRIAETLSKQDPKNAEWQRDLSVSYDRIGDVKVSQGDQAGALASYESGLRIRETLSKQDPKNAAWQRDLSVSYDNIGDVKVSQGDQAGALASYESGLRIRETLSKQDPKNAAWQRDLSVSYDNIGDVKVSQGDQAGALASYESGLRIRETLSKQDPKNAAWQRDLSVSYDNIGDAKVSQGDQAGALASYESGLRIAETLSKQDPKNAEWQRDLSVSYTKLGQLMAKQKQTAAARDRFQKARAISARLVQLAPTNAVWKNDLAWTDAQLAKLK